MIMIIHYYFAIMIMIMHFDYDNALYIMHEVTGLDKMACSSRVAVTDGRVA